MQMEKRKKTIILLILSIVWSILIFVLCTMPANDLPKYRILYMDKIAHFGFFFVQSVLLSLLLRYRTKRSYLDIIILSTFQAFLYGGVIEFLQNEFFNRTGDLYYLMADTLGWLLGAVTYPGFFRLFNKRAKKYT